LTFAAKKSQSRNNLISAIAINHIHRYMTGKKYDPQKTLKENEPTANPVAGLCNGPTKNLARIVLCAISRPLSDAAQLISLEYPTG